MTKKHSFVRDETYTPKKNAPDDVVIIIERVSMAFVCIIWGIMYRKKCVSIIIYTEIF